MEKVSPSELWCTWVPKIFLSSSRQQSLKLTSSRAVAYFWACLGLGHQLCRMPRIPFIERSAVFLHWSNMQAHWKYKGNMETLSQFSFFAISLCRGIHLFWFIWTILAWGMGFSCIFLFVIIQKKYRQNASALKFTSVEDTPEMIQAKVSNKLAVDVSIAPQHCF